MLSNFDKGSDVDSIQVDSDRSLISSIGEGSSIQLLSAEISQLFQNLPKETERLHIGSL